jgi:hypothetical protein
MEKKGYFKSLVLKKISSSWSIKRTVDGKSSKQICLYDCNTHVPKLKKKIPCWVNVNVLSKSYGLHSLVVAL